MKVRYADRAKRHLADIAEHIAQDNPSAAGKLVASVRRAVDRLGVFPEACRVGQVAGTRELIVPRTSYIVVYRVRSGGIDILGVHHAARHPSVRRRP